MRKGFILRVVAVLLTTLILFQLSGCNSVIAQTAVVLREENDNDNNVGWDFNSYSTEILNVYPSGGTNAFYLDSIKCQILSIEEFHVLGFNGSTFLYFYTAPANPYYKGKDKNSAFYCLATYIPAAGVYREVCSGFYNSNDSVSMAYDSDAEGNIVACVGNTFMFFSDMTLRNSFSLNDDMKETIRDGVAEQYICIDIAYVDPALYSIAAVYMDASEIGEDDDEPECVLYNIEFDIGTEGKHDIDEIEDGIDSSHGNICSSYCDDGVFREMYYHRESDSKDYVKVKIYSPNALIYGDKNAKLYSKYKREDLRSFSVTADYGKLEIMLALLYDNRLDVWKRIDNYLDGGKAFDYSHVSRFPLDDSRTYISMDDMPSVILVNAEDKILTCSLEDGFKQVGAENSSVQTYTIKQGAYYAAYSTAEKNYYYLLGFDTVTHKAITRTLKDGKEIGRRTDYIPYSISDLPYAYIYGVSHYVD